MESTRAGAGAGGTRSAGGIGGGGVILQEVEVPGGVLQHLHLPHLALHLPQSATGAGQVQVGGLQVQVQVPGAGTGTMGQVQVPWVRYRCFTIDLIGT